MYEIFARLLQDKGLTAYRVSQDTGISQATLSDWKHGRSTPKLPKLQAIADYLGVPLGYLMGLPQEALPDPEYRPTDEEIKKALFGDIEVTDAVYEEVKAYARFVREREKDK